MKRRSKVEKGHGIIREVIAQNVRMLRDQKFASIPAVTNRNKELARLADTSLSQIQRLTDGTLGTSVDFVEVMAHILGVGPHELLIPYFASSSRHGASAVKEAIQRSPEQERPKKISRTP